MQAAPAGAAIPDKRLTHAKEGPMAKANHDSISLPKRLKAHARQAHSEGCVDLAHDLRAAARRLGALEAEYSAAMKIAQRIARRLGVSQ
jgi:hypothetical protein